MRWSNSSHTRLQQTSQITESMILIGSFTSYPKLRRRHRHLHGHASHERYAVSNDEGQEISTSPSRNWVQTGPPTSQLGACMLYKLCYCAFFFTKRTCVPGDSETNKNFKTPSAAKKCTRLLHSKKWITSSKKTKNHQQSAVWNRHGFTSDLKEVSKRDVVSETGSEFQIWRAALRKLLPPPSTKKFLRVPGTSKSSAVFKGRATYSTL